MAADVAGTAPRRATSCPIAGAAPPRVAHLPAGSPAPFSATAGMPNVSPPESPVGYTNSRKPVCRATDGKWAPTRLGSWHGLGCSVGVGACVSPVVVRVLVLYSHPLMGEGLERMLASEPGVEVDSADVSMPGAVDAALARDPEVIIVEEGGPLDAADIVRRTNCSVVLDVDINTTAAFSLRRETLSTRPDDFLARLRSAVTRVIDCGGGYDTDLGVQQAVVSG